MLRITTVAGGNPTTLQVEGSLAGPWVDELRSACERLACGAFGSQRPRIVLDLANVWFVDDAGIHLLQELRGQGASISRSSSFVTELLAMETP